MLNRIVLMGRLVREPELKHTPQGVPVCTFTLAVDRDVKGADGERVTDFIDIVAWRSTGEFAAKYLTKGRMAAVEGRLQLRDWQDKDGNKRRNAEILASSVYFADSNRDTGNGMSPAYPSRTLAGFSEMVGSDDELPF